MRTGRDVVVGGAARRRRVRVLDRAADRDGLHHDARLPPEHLPGRDRHPGSRAAQALPRHARARRQLPDARRRGGPRDHGLARHPAVRGHDRPHRAARHRAARSTTGRPAESTCRWCSTRRICRPGRRAAGRAAQQPVLDDALDWELVRRCAPALERREPVKLGPIPVRNVNRTVGGILCGEIARRHGAGGLRGGDDRDLVQRLGRAELRAPGWRPGVMFSLRGETNDYAGKGLSGGVVVGPAARGRALPGRGQHDRRQHRPVRRDRRPRVLPRARRRAFRGPQLRGAARSSRASATTAAST